MTSARAVRAEPGHAQAPDRDPSQAGWRRAFTNFGPSLNRTHGERASAVKRHPEGLPADYVLDTNVLAALMRGDERVITRLERVTRPMVAVPEPAWSEIAYGLSRMPPSRRRERLSGRYALLREQLPTAPWTSEVTDAFGTLKSSLERKGQRLEDFDLAIAAHALAAEAVLVTANVRHLARITELQVEDWG